MKKLKAGLYPRVSHHDQAEFGHSLEAQKDHLIKLCEYKGYEIHDIYEDAGISAKNMERPEFQRMLDDMRNGKIDIIVCYKLDRLTRSLADLDWLLKEMDKYNCDLVSASEDINTSSANGRFFIKIVILLAELELERTSERIKFVFDDKIKKGGAVTGGQPLGYKIGINENNEKIVVIDEEKKDMVNDLFDHFEKYQSLRKTAFYINEKYGTKKDSTSIRKLLKTTMFYGYHRGNPNYTTPYMTKERWDKLNKIVIDKNVKSNNSFDYIFSGLLKDKCCGRNLAGCYKQNKHNITFSYRCHWYVKNRSCTSNKIVNEAWLEDYLINNIDSYLKDYYSTLDLEYTKSVELFQDNTEQIALLKAEKSRITTSFNKGWIDETEADKEHERINKEIEKLRNKPIRKTVEHLNELSNKEWKDMYFQLDRLKKQMFWRTIIDHIEIEPNHYKEGKEFIKIIFL